MDIHKNIDVPKTTVLFSINIELIGAVHLLANSSHHEFAKEWVDITYKNISEASREFLKIIPKLPMAGIELYSLFISTRDFDDVEGFLQRIEKTNDLDFISEVYDVEREKVISIRENPEELPKFMEDNYMVEEECREGLEYILYETTSFRRGLVKVLGEIYNQLFTDKIKTLEELFTHSIDSINNQLKSKKPLVVAQELMGKTFHRVFPFKEFIFIPSYFLSPHRFRTFTPEVQILIYDVRRDCLYLNEVGEKITNAMKVLSDRTRLEIVRQLLLGPTYGKVLASRLDLTTATISHHLEQLRAVGLIEEDKVKNTKYFNVKKDELEKLLGQISDYLYNKL
ncbi:winged helix-turn-helix transcriptional regulator [Alkalicella caledoniensis]|uniref:Winged helix-turn-helix transcriptional regulator n=1 Tax=Alkalicella caledoniensis TaxID=2731377 RepID=A0A7G9WB06_ALKCA|nr:winged helix-turn-helix domain-containing protein [Alkalicella caledoniensis]QNO15868.1 winged helix-turn-helix transcriptional regulator [Alkalicella caledoniensis]